MRTIVRKLPRARPIADIWNTNARPYAAPPRSWRRAREATARHTELSTAPDSIFVKVLAVQRRDADGVDLLRSVSLTRIDRAGRRERVLESSADFVGVLRGVFGMNLSGMPPTELDAVLRRQSESYAAYLTTKAARA